MTTLLWIILFGLLMSAIALVGALTLILVEATLQRLLLPPVAFAAGAVDLIPEFAKECRPRASSSPAWAPCSWSPARAAA